MSSSIVLGEKSSSRRIGLIRGNAATGTCTYPWPTSTARAVRSRPSTRLADNGEGRDGQITGDVLAGTFTISVVDREESLDGDADTGLLRSANAVFRDRPTELAYVEITNEGPMPDTGGYHLNYESLYLAGGA